MLVNMNVLGIIEQVIFKLSVWNRRKHLSYVNGSVCMARQNDPTPECVVNGTSQVMRTFLVGAAYQSYQANGDSTLMYNSQILMPSTNPY